jgi:transcriptional adapter 3
MPRLERHYTEIWEEQDNGLLFIPLVGDSLDPDPDSRGGWLGAGGIVGVGRELPKWDPSTLTDADCQVEERGHGPLTERVLSALLPAPDHAWKGVKAAEDAMEGRPGGSGAAAARRERMNVADLEVRIRDRMRWHGLLPDGVVGFSFPCSFLTSFLFVGSIVSGRRKS